MAPAGSNEGSAGASARREYERHKRRRERAVREKHPRIGGLLLALKEPPAQERRWARGAGGEEMVADALAKRCRPELVVLHDRAIPGRARTSTTSRSHPSGVWVIDTKRYTGKIKVANPLLGAAKLTIGGSDQTRLVAGLAKQVDIVTRALETVRVDVPVRGAFCFVHGDLPLLRTLTINGFALLHRRSLQKRLNADGPLGVGGIVRVAEELARTFPPA